MAAVYKYVIVLTENTPEKVKVLIKTTKELDIFIDKLETLHLGKFWIL